MLPGGRLPTVVEHGANYFRRFSTRQLGRPRVIIVAQFTKSSDLQHLASLYVVRHSAAINIPVLPAPCGNFTGCTLSHRIETHCPPMQDLFNSSATLPGNKEIDGLGQEQGRLQVEKCRLVRRIACRKAKAEAKAFNHSRGCTQREGQS